MSVGGAEMMKFLRLPVFEEAFGNLHNARPVL